LPDLSICQGEAWDMWFWLDRLHRGRRTPIDAKEIESALSIFSVVDPTRRIELARLVAQLEREFLEYDPEGDEEVA